jgi:hypothetical protein
MAGIGERTFSLLTLETPAEPLTIFVETINREGQARPRYRDGGLRSVPSQYVSLERFTTASALKAGLIAYKVIEGTAVVLEDDLENEYNVIVKRVTSLSQKLMEAVSSSEGSGNYVLRARWEVEVLG